MKEEEMKKANEQLRLYRLELVNRENNYNKMFNANPNVGTLDPISFKVNLNLLIALIPRNNKAQVRLQRKRYRYELHSLPSNYQ